MKNQQLEIGLRSPTCRRPATLRQRRVARARWWFSQMRRVVDEAIEWKGASAKEEPPRQPLAQGR